MAQPPTGPPAGLPDLGQGMEQARHLLQQNKPMEALRVMTDMLRALGMGQEADDCLIRVQQALAGGGSDGSAGGASNHAVVELASLMSLISLQAPQPGQPHNAAQHPQLQQQQAGSSSGEADMDVEGSAGPGPHSSSSAGGGDSPSRPGRLVAAAEGATYVCQQCGGLLSVERGQAHQQLWCPALHPS